MSDTRPSLQIAAQFIKETAFTALVRPYENKDPVQVSFETATHQRKLEKPGHWHIEQSVSLLGKAGETHLYNARVVQEFIVVVQGANDETSASMLRLQIPARMFANARAQLASLTMSTGYGPLTLPPVPDAYILKSNKSENGT